MSNSKNNRNGNWNKNSYSHNHSEDYFDRAEDHFRMSRNDDGRQSGKRRDMDRKNKRRNKEFLSSGNW